MNFELERKKALLAALIEDVEIFGPAGDDLARIAALKKEIDHGKLSTQVSLFRLTANATSKSHTVSFPR